MIKKKARYIDPDIDYSQIDLVIDDEDLHFEDDKRDSKRPNKEGHELYNFLENEKNRLEKIDDLFSIKTHNAETYPQLKSLLLHQEKQLKKYKEELIQEMFRESSIPLEKIDRFLKKNFRPKHKK